VLSSTVLAGLVAALVSLRSSERKIHVENVTQERAKWRNAMRELANAIITAATSDKAVETKRQSAQLALNVNPFDTEDIGLVEAAKKFSTSTDLNSHIEEFTDRMTLLLKHDWERAKREAQPWFFRGSEPRRVPFCEYKATKGAQVATNINSPRKASWRLCAYFATLAFSAGILFFLAVGLTAPFHDLVKLFNDSSKEKPASHWAWFVFMSVLCGSIWSAAYLWFKGSEKKFLDIWFSK